MTSARERRPADLRILFKCIALRSGLVETVLILPIAGHSLIYFRRADC